jgi:hypothetical protein
VLDAGTQEGMQRLPLAGAEVGRVGQQQMPRCSCYVTPTDCRPNAP